MSLGVRIAQKQRITLAQAGVSPIYGIMRDRQGMRPSGLNLQVIRNAGTSVHSVLVEGAGDLSGPWETLATITDQLITKYTTKIPDYIRATATTSTGGTLDFLIEGVVSGGGGGAASNISLTTDTAPNQGTTTTVLHGNAAGQPSFGAVVQADVTNGFVDLNTNQAAIAGNKTFTGSTAFNNVADKLGSTSIIADSASINTTETVVIKTAALGANRLVAGTVIRITLLGTCTASAGNGSNFRIRIGTAGTTADTQVFIISTPASATTGTNVPFRVVLELTVRTTGAAATAVGLFTLENQGVTGISTAAVQLINGSMAAFDTTANDIVSATYNTGGATTTSQFQQAMIEIVNK